MLRLMTQINLNWKLVSSFSTRKPLRKFCFLRNPIWSYVIDQSPDYITLAVAIRKSAFMCQWPVATAPQPMIISALANRSGSGMIYILHGNIPIKTQVLQEMRWVIQKVVSILKQSPSTGQRRNAV